jgi:DNA-binding transcriptional LysR family regulator
MADLSSINLNRLVIFAAVVEAGSLTAAAERLGLAKTMVSKHMQLLEAELGVALLVRSTRRLGLTEAGRAFHASCRLLLKSAEEAVELARTGRDTPHGKLRVAAPIDYGALVVAPVLAQLRQQWPALQIELICGDDLIDLIAQNIDVAVRLGKLADSGHMAVRVGGFARWPVASPAFVAAHGMPKDPAALAALPYVALSVLPQPRQYTLSKATGKGMGKTHSIRMSNPAFSTNTATGCHAATLAGAGWMVATDFSAAADIAAGRLVRLLPGWSLPCSDIHTLFPASPHRQQKVRVFIDAMKAVTGG